MKINLRLIFASIPFIFLCVGQVWALSLGNISVAPNSSGEPFEARVNLKLTDQEKKTISAIDVKEAGTQTYEMLGVSKPETHDQFAFKVVSDSSGIPQYIQIISKKPLEQSGKIFKDIVIEVKWSSGSIRRVYTILSDKTKNVTVPEGGTLGELALKMQPDVGGASFDQTLIALYRTNPQAFVSGNIHRLKAGEVLRAPSAAMVKSIPLDESKNIADSIYQNYQSGQLSTSTEDAKPISKLDSSLPKKEPSGDRLNIRSSSGSDDVDKQLSNQIEELVAQEKILADAKQRIAELEKNIDDLKKISSKSKNTGFFSQEDLLLKAFISIFMLLFVAVLTFIILNKRSNKGEAKSLGRLDLNVKPINPQVLNSSPSLEASDNVANPISSDRAKALFAGIDLNLDSPPKQIINKKLSSPSELRVKLNLAKSYLKIDDLVMAKIILDEIISNDSDFSSEMAREARQLRALISV